MENSVPASDYNRAVQQRKELETQLELCSDALKEKTKAVENMEEEAEAFRVQISELRETVRESFSVCVCASAPALMFQIQYSDTHRISHSSHIYRDACII